MICVYALAIGVNQRAVTTDDVPLVAACLKEMDRLPIIGFKGPKNETVIGLLRKVSSYRPAVVRAAMVCLMVRGFTGESSNCSGKAFLVNRSYFDIPAKKQVIYWDLPFWGKAPISRRETVAATWPFAFEKSPQYEEIVLLAGGGFSSYDPVGEFDSYSLEYEVRRVKDFKE